MRILRTVTVFVSLLLIFGASQAQERTHAVNPVLSSQLQARQIAYAVASYKVDSLNGNKSTAEHMAKNLRQRWSEMRKG